jgi:flagellar hook assembly protein FlgD
MKARFFHAAVIASIAIALASFVSTSISADFNPPPGGPDLPALWSAFSAASGSSGAQYRGPASYRDNPASPGFAENAAMEIAGGYFPGSTPGGSFSTSLSLPYQTLVFSGGIQGIFSPSNGAVPGNSFTAGGGIARRVFEDISAGASLDFSEGSGNSLDWGLGLSLGIMAKFPRLLFLDNASLGFAMRDIGKMYESVDGFTSPVPGFTPAASVSGMFFSSKSLSSGLSAEISVPSFQDLRLTTDTFVAGTAWKGDIGFVLDLVDQFTRQGSRKRILSPSIGISYRIPDSERLSSDTEYRDGLVTGLSVTPLGNGKAGILAGAIVPLSKQKPIPPEVLVDLSEDPSISPRLNRGLKLPAQFKSSAPIAAYDFSIFDSAHREVFHFGDAVAKPDRSFGGFWKALLSDRGSVLPPAFFTWDGYSPEKTPVPDGLYAFSIGAVDSRGIRASNAVGSFEVNSTPPALSLSYSNPSLVFSPNGDGIADSFDIVQDGAFEPLWVGTIADSTGKPIRKITFENGSPRPFSWDGRDDSGRLAPDGLYSYTITAEDRAGNRTARSIPGIRLDSRRTPVDVDVSPTSFSPDGDGIQDTVTFRLSIPDRVGILGWKLEVLATDGTPKRTYSSDAGQSSQPPSSIVFNGRDEGGKILLDGRYRTRLSARYDNGNHPEVYGPSFLVDTAKPTAKATSRVSVFSPGSGGDRDTVTIDQVVSKRSVWKGEVTDSSGTVVKSYFWDGTADPVLVWDGRNDDGFPCADGRYQYRLFTVDSAGNVGTSMPISIAIDTTQVQIALTATAVAFSPNRDGTDDTIGLVCRILADQAVQSWEMDIKDEKGANVRNYSGSGAVPQKTEWDGRTAAGAALPDGTYYAELTVLSPSGVRSLSRSKTFSLDTVPPTVTVSVPFLDFSPSGGMRTVLPFTQESSVETGWTGLISTETGKPVRTIEWKGRVESFVWDGTDDSGDPVPNGRYRYRVSAVDEAGNRGEASINGISLDRTVPSVGLRYETTGFSPNGDGTADYQTFYPQIRPIEGITDWKLEVMDGDGTVRKTFSGSGGNLPDRIFWDGKTDSGMMVDGTYSGRLSVRYVKGYNLSASTGTFLLAATPPEIFVDTDPVPFAPRGNGIDDLMSINLNVRSKARIRDWSIRITDPKGKPFMYFAGKDAPSQPISWDGRSLEGETVRSTETYGYVAVVTDVLGNRGATHGTIPVGVAFEKEGTGLRTRIWALAFAPGMDSLVTGDIGTDTKNLAVLAELEAAFAEYPGYGITIVDHELNQTGTEKEETTVLADLSQRRADAVLNALSNAGVDRARMKARGAGGREPLVPFTDLTNRWKNGRLEFILEK